MKEVTCELCGARVTHRKSKDITVVEENGTHLSGRFCKSHPEMIAYDKLQQMISAKKAEFLNMLVWKSKTPERPDVYARMDRNLAAYINANQFTSAVAHLKAVYCTAEDHEAVEAVVNKWYNEITAMKKVEILRITFKEEKVA